MAEQVKTTLCQIDKIDERKATLIPIDEALGSETVSACLLPDGTEESDIVELSFKVFPELRQRERGLIDGLLKELRKQ